MGFRLHGVFQISCCTGALRCYKSLNFRESGFQGFRVLEFRLPRLEVLKFAT